MSSILNTPPSFNRPHTHSRLLSPPRKEHVHKLPPTQNTGRTPNDQRSAEQIADNTLFDALKQYPTHLIKGFYEHIGGDWNNEHLTPQARADLAADAERVLEHIDRRGGARSNANNHKIDGRKFAGPKIAPGGLRQEWVAEKSSEAWRLLDFAKDGYRALIEFQPLTGPK